jgi:hypothetical protein
MKSSTASNCPSNRKREDRSLASQTPTPKGSWVRDSRGIIPTFRYRPILYTCLQQNCCSLTALDNACTQDLNSMDFILLKAILFKRRKAAIKVNTKSFPPMAVWRLALVLFTPWRRWRTRRFAAQRNFRPLKCAPPVFASLPHYYYLANHRCAWRTNDGRATVAAPQRTRRRLQLYPPFPRP